MQFCCNYICKGEFLYNITQALGRYKLIALFAKYACLLCCFFFFFKQRQFYCHIIYRAINVRVVGKKEAI